MRYGKIIKRIVSTFFLVQMGGLKAVLWTDTYQLILMLICVLVFFITGIQYAGGVTNIYEKAQAGKRFDNLFNLRLDFTERFNFWSSVLRGFTYGCTMFGMNQLDVQRILSLSNAKRAKSTLRLSIFPTTALYVLCLIFGIVLYGIYHDCDPVLNREQTGLTKHDQMVPAFIVSRLSHYPGMTGLCIAGIFSASLSSLSSQLNCASTVTVMDFIRPAFKTRQISEEKFVWLAKILSIVYGVICMGLSFCFLGFKSIRRLMFALIFTTEGPMMAIFLVAVLSRKASDRCVSFAYIIGVLTVMWISLGSLFSNYSQPPLPLSVSGCALSENSTMAFNTLSTNLPFSTIDSKNIFFLYRISHMWYSTIGFLLTLVCIFIMVLITGWKNNVIPSDSKCLSPVVRKQQVKKLCINSMNMNEK